MSTIELQTVKHFIERLGLRLVATPTDKNPNIQDDEWPADHWRVTVFRDGGAPMSLFFSCGKGLGGVAPTSERIVEALLSDQTWEDDELDRHLTQVLRRQTRKLHAFLGDEYHNFVRLEVA